MATGKVKWFNAKKVTALFSRMTAATMCSFTSGCERAGFSSSGEGTKVSYELKV